MGAAVSRLRGKETSAKKEGKQPKQFRRRTLTKKDRRPQGILEDGVFDVFHVVYYPETVNTHFIFVGQNESGGEMHHIVGSDSTRHYEVRESDSPSQVSPNFSTTTWIGTVERDNYTRFREVCRSVPPPKKEGSVWMYSYQGNPMRSTEQWTVAVIDALFSENLLG